MNIYLIKNLPLLYTSIIMALILACSGLAKADVNDHSKISKIRISGKKKLPATNSKINEKKMKVKSVKSLGIKVEDNISYDPATPLDQQVIVLTSFGNIIIKLNPKSAPKSVELFKKLVLSGYYNTTSFYRFINQYLIQAGDPSALGIGDAGLTIPNESKTAVKFSPGTVALANINNSPSMTGSQFFITFISSPWLNGKYNTIGHVISGLDILSTFFDKYITNQKGIMNHPVPIRVYMMSDFKNRFPSLKSKFKPMTFEVTNAIKKVKEKSNSLKILNSLNDKTLPKIESSYSAYFNQMLLGSTDSIYALPMFFY